MPSGARSDIFGRIIGMLVFFMGVGLLCIVFYIAFRLFNMAPEAALGVNTAANPKADLTVMKISSLILGLFWRIGLLAIMSVLGSLIANKGINLYFSALQGSPIHSVVHPPAVAPVVQAAPPAE